MMSSLYAEASLKECVNSFGFSQPEIFCKTDLYCSSLKSGWSAETRPDDRNSITPESGRELKSPHNRSWTQLVSGLCPGRKLWLASSKMLFSSYDNIMVWINLTSQNSGSQWMWAVHTRIGWLIWLGSGGKPEIKSNSFKTLSMLLVRISIIVNRLIIITSY